MVDILNFRHDAAASEAPVSLEDFLGQSNATAVRIEPGEDARALLPHLERIALIEVTFPSFGDGRGYSSGQILRESGYTGEMRASGDVLLDQIRHFYRCGFDSFAPNKPIARDAAEEAIARYDFVYQKAADGRTPVWKLRHG